jgi:hypothetical protein
MTEKPYVHITPCRIGFSIRFGDEGSLQGGIPIQLGGTAWRLTRRMAEARGRRWLRRVERANDREERAWALDGSE